jgi:hypothetical protein
MRQGATSLRSTDAFQLAGAGLAVGGAAIDGRTIIGAVVVVIAAAGQALATRREHIPPVKTIGLRQMAIGFGVVAATTLGVVL